VFGVSIIIIIIIIIKGVACTQGRGKCYKVGEANWQWGRDWRGFRRHCWADEGWGQSSHWVSGSWVMGQMGRQM